MSGVRDAIELSVAGRMVAAGIDPVTDVVAIFPFWAGSDEDHSGQGSPIAPQGAPTIANSELTLDGTGNQWVHSGSLIVPPGSDFTLAIRFYSIDTDDGQLIGWVDADVWYRYYGLAILGDGQVRAINYNGGGGPGVLDTSDVRDGQWHTAVARFWDSDTNVLDLHVDGRYVGEGGGSGVISQLDLFCMGMWRDDSPGSPLTGGIDNAAVFARAWTDDEVAGYSTMGAL